LSEPGFTPAIDRLVILTSILDPVAERRRQWEDVRAELMLQDAEFEPDFNALDQIIPALLALISWFVQLSFGAAMASDPLPSPEVEPEPDPQIEVSSDMAP
jgi:hypothetical protein